jgi:hypothetical protein
MKIKGLVVGNTYTRPQIHDAVGGGSLQSYLPHKDGAVLAGCFRPDWNKRAPAEVDAGYGPKVIAYAKRVAATHAEIPVFLKRDTHRWEYQGIYRCLRFSEKKRDLQAHENRRKDAVGVLYFEAVNDDAKESNLPAPQAATGPLKITRISFNSSEWRRPTGDAREYEEAGTYNHKHGFGHEDWLFRSEWLIRGWRYAFIQGVNKSHARLVKSGQPVDLTLFTKQPDGKRRYVATIRAVECLGDQQAKDALKEFKGRGWFSLMKREIRAVKGNVSALGATKWAKHVLNVRFRLENVALFPPKTFAAAGDPVLKKSRYMLYDGATIEQSAKALAKRASAGSVELPGTKSFKRGAVAEVECTPEHAHMQAKLMQKLKEEHPHDQIVRENDFIDVSVRTKTELLLFEIKSDLEPRSVIRHALGQILEYAFYPTRQHTLPLKLVIVGRCALSTDDMAYLRLLQQKFRLPVSYRVMTF